MSNWQLQKNGFRPRRGPVVVVVLDGVGWGANNEGNAIYLADTPTLDRLWSRYPTRLLAAHGTAVGLPSDADMGNSEVGHNALGAGRVFDQGAKLVEAALADGSIYESPVWAELRDRAAAGATLHFIGLLSDGNVHSHVDHLYALVRRCDADGIAKVRIHILLDGRDVGPQTSLHYVAALEAELARVNKTAERDYAIASGGGRMRITMDRYEADWSMVERGWRTHVHGEGTRASSARAAIEAQRAAQPAISDQNLEAFVVERDGAPIGPIVDGDAVVLLNFRGDRAIEISRAFEDDSLTTFDRGRRPQVLYAGMMQYDGDLGVPSRFLVSPPAIEGTMGEYLAQNGVAQFACAETQKFGHVTYFWNGNRSGAFDAKTETYVECTSDCVPFEQRPWMKAAEVTDATIAAIEGGRFAFMRVNYANGDMVGHTGHVGAARIAVECVDLCLARLLAAVEVAGGIALVTADHGNSDEMYEVDPKTSLILNDGQGRPRSKTSHTLNPVPLTIFDPGSRGEYLFDSSIEKPGLGHVAATALWLMGYSAPEHFLPALVRAES